MSFLLNDKNYFQDHGVNIMVFDDIYPAGHQSGVSILMNGKRVATNGDVRFEQTPGQWQPVPKQQKRVVDHEANQITTTLGYPDMEAHLHGFNPIIYPDFEFNYDVVVTGSDDVIDITVHLDRPIAPQFAGKLCFNLELFPGDLFGKPWIMDDKSGIFPVQPNGPTKIQSSNYQYTGKIKPLSKAKADREKLAGYNKGYSPIIADDLISLPYAEGHVFTVFPDDSLRRFTIESKDTPLQLYDGRLNHNNGWFVISSAIPLGKTKDAIHWQIRPHVDKEWIYTPVVQTSQVGYHPDQPKQVVIELDQRDTSRSKVILQKLTIEGYQDIRELVITEWGDFLRYHYLVCDFSDVKEDGIYRILYKEQFSANFRISKDIYDRGVWQPVLEYFLPVQMCHMRVNEKYRVWHGHCHHDDARMAPVDYEQFDGAAQGPETLTKYKPGDHVPGLNAGGWHDAGDFDLRIESQTGEMYRLAAAFEEFDVYLDETTIDQEHHLVEIHQPDGKNDILQQVEHGALSVVNAYKSLGRLYHEIMCGDLRQYVLLGDASTMTSNIPGGEDERLVFTENNPTRELEAAAHLACSARALKDFNPALSDDCLAIAKELFAITGGSGFTERTAYDPAEEAKDMTENMRIFAACELFLSTQSEEYKDFLISKLSYIQENAKDVAWCVCRVVHKLGDPKFESEIREICMKTKAVLDELSRETPYGIPYRPHIWGAGWGIQELAMNYYFLHKAFPDIFPKDLLYNALNFILGCHPGSNTASFASGVGAKSNLTAYGANRADWSFIPGGVSSGTALIRPDFPELLEFPFLWQQGEYVLGGGSSNYLFLVHAVKNSLR